MKRKLQDPLSVSAECPHLKSVQEIFQILIFIQASGVKHPVLVQQLIHEEVHKSDLEGSTQPLALRSLVLGMSTQRFSHLSCIFNQLRM